MIRWELYKLVRQRRTLFGLGAMALVPVLFVAALEITREGPPEGEAPFATQLLENGLVVPLVTLAFATFVLLPLVVAFVAGDAVAGEVSAGTLKTILSRSVGRTELLLSKAAALGVYCLAVVRIEDRRRRGPARLAVHRVLDLHDVGTEPRQQLRRERHRRHLLEREHPHAIERLPVLRGALVGDVAYSQPAPRSAVARLCRAAAAHRQVVPTRTRRAHQPERAHRIVLALDLDGAERFDDGPRRRGARVSLRR